VNLLHKEWCCQEDKLRSTPNIRSTGVRGINLDDGDSIVNGQDLFIPRCLSGYFIVYQKKGSMYKV